MIGESPEWALWVMVGLLAFIMLLPIIKRYRAPRCRLAADARGAA
jgi:hypothetical protein